jgi:hypothetical protein
MSERSNYRGLAFSAVSVTVRPAADRSRPAPDVVLQAASKGMAPSSSTRANAADGFFRMAEFLQLRRAFPARFVVTLGNTA